MKLKKNVVARLGLALVTLGAGLTISCGIDKQDRRVPGFDTTKLVGSWQRTSDISITDAELYFAANGEFKMISDLEKSQEKGTLEGKYRAHSTGLIHIIEPSSEADSISRSYQITKLGDDSLALSVSMDNGDFAVQEYARIPEALFESSWTLAISELTTAPQSTLSQTSTSSAGSAGASAGAIPLPAVAGGAAVLASDPARPEIIVQAPEDRRPPAPKPRPTDDGLPPMVVNPPQLGL